MAQNSLLHPVDELHYDTYKPAHAAAALKATEAIARQNLAAIEAVESGKHTIKNTLLALTRATDDFDSVVGKISHLESVIGEPWRKADLLATERATELGNDISLNKKLYDAMIALRESPAHAKATTAEKRLLKDIIEDYERGGIALPAAKQKRLRAIRQALSEASTRFSQNVVKALDASGMHVLDAAELKGMTADFKAECRKAAQKKKLNGYWVQRSEPNYIKIMTDCEVRATRLAMHKAGRDDSLMPNEQLTKDILKLRYELAALLGYKTYADFATADRMAKTGTTAREFIRELRKRYQPGVAGEHAALEEFAKTYERDPNFKLHISDVESGLDFYYAQRLRNQQFDLDEKELAKYFPAPVVLQGMFDTLSTLYGVTFKQLPDVPAWHKTVDVYAIYDEAGGHLATVWCDWYARDGKHRGAWMNNLYVADRANGTIDKPHLGHVCANLDPPRGNKPSMLTFDDVRVIWHEFGHFMHLTMNRTELPEQSMIGCEWDFIEAPSQIMENWPWQTEVLKQITKHSETGQPMPDELIQKLQASQLFRVAGKAARQLMFAEWDLALHMDYADAPPEDPLKVCADIKHSIYNMELAPYDKTLLTFTHIFAGGYAAGYYSYKWAEAIEADLFALIKEQGVLNPSVGRRYRDKVLARGSEVDAADIVRDFLGRDSTPDAMLKRDGLL
jgi:oligopeptidase A